MVHITCNHFSQPAYTQNNQCYFSWLKTVLLLGDKCARREQQTPQSKHPALCNTKTTDVLHISKHTNIKIVCCTYHWFIYTVSIEALSVLWLQLLYLLGYFFWLNHKVSCDTSHFWDHHYIKYGHAYRITNYFVN